MSLLTGIFADILEEQRQAMRDAAIIRAAEQRSSLENPQTPLSYPAEWLLDIFNGGRTDSGVRVSELTAFQVTTFYACVDLIAGSIAALPVHVYERSFLQKSGRAVHRVAYDHDLYDLVHTEPNDEMSRFVMMKAFVAHMLAWGNGYIEIQRDQGNRPVALWPRNPAKTRPYRLLDALQLKPETWRPFPLSLPAGTLVFKTTDGLETEDESFPDGQSGGGRIIAAEDMLHVPGLALDGRVGQQTVWLARQLLGLALATEKFGSKYFANFARPSGILELPALKKEDREAARQSWQEAQGGENSNRVAVMPPGAKFTAMANNPQEAQTTETRQFLRNEICSIFHVPPHMVGDVDKGRANTEQLAQEFVSYTLGQWLTAIKQEAKRKLFPNTGVGRTPKSRFYVDFDLWNMLRPTAADRESFYATGKQWGYLCTNDILGLEGMNPIDEPWAEDHWMPINMTLVDTPIDPTHQDGSGNGDAPPKDEGDDSKDADKQARALCRAYGRLFHDAFGRVLSRSDLEKRDLRCIQNAFAPILYSLRDALWPTRELDPGAESDTFIAGYISAMQKRAAGWTSESEAGELARAIRAIRIAVERDAATQKAKAAAEEQK